jgi:hypothetical protein
LSRSRRSDAPDFFKGTPPKEPKPGEPGYHGDIKNFGTFEEPYQKLGPRTPWGLYAACLLTAGLGVLLLATAAFCQKYPAEPRSNLPQVGQYAIGQADTNTYQLC